MEIIPSLFCEFNKTKVNIKKFFKGYDQDNITDFSVDKNAKLRFMP